jgi:hypothetical protein
MHLAVDGLCHAGFAGLWCQASQCAELEVTFDAPAPNSKGVLCFFPTRLRPYPLVPHLND